MIFATGNISYPISFARRLATMFMKYQAGDYWKSHVPPVLLRMHEGKMQDVIEINPFTHEETFEMGLVFDHFAFTTEQQLKFKESYYPKNGNGSW